MCKIHIIDAICGSRKTETMINYINSRPLNEKFLYITPLLSEVERIKHSCISRNFQEPKVLGTKINGIKYLFDKGCNIVSTHALFKLFDEEIMDLTKFYGYTLIMDEVADVVEPIRITSYDLSTLLEKYTKIEDNHMLSWTTKSYRGEFEKYKRLCDLESVYVYGDDNTNRIALLWMFPVKVFNSFKEVFILTYLFDAQIQRYYYDYHNVKYDFLYIKDTHITDVPQLVDTSQYKELINVCTSKTLNSIGDTPYSLSSRWYERNKRNILMKKMKNNCVNYFKHIAGTPSVFNMWTTFKEYRPLIKGSGYAKGFVGLNIRATNEYIFKESVAYLVNKYMNPVVKNFFQSNGIAVNEDLYALSELIQFLFRTQIRRGRPINLYLPSKRERDILDKWLNNEIEKI